MADAASISKETLARTRQRYLREGTLRATNNRLVNHHHRLPLAQAWGGGTLSSSDGQRFRSVGAASPPGGDRQRGLPSISSWVAEHLVEN